MLLSLPLNDADLGYCCLKVKVRCCERTWQDREVLDGSAEGSPKSPSQLFPHQTGSFLKVSSEINRTPDRKCFVGNTPELLSLSLFSLSPRTKLLLRHSALPPFPVCLVCSFQACHCFFFFPFQPLNWFLPLVDQISAVVLFPLVLKTQRKEITVWFHYQWVWTE